MNAVPDDLTPEMQSLAHRLGALPFPGPDAAARSRMRTQFERTLASPHPPWWARKLYLGAVAAALALGLGAAGATSRSPVDVMRHPGGVVQDIVRNVTGERTEPIVVCDDDGHHDDAIRSPDDDCDDGGFDDHDNSGSGSGDDDRLEDHDNSGSGSGNDDLLEDDHDNSGSGSGDDDRLEDDDHSGSGSGDDDRLEDDHDNSGSGSGDDDAFDDHSDSGSGHEGRED